MKQFYFIAISCILSIPTFGQKNLNYITENPTNSSELLEPMFNYQNKNRSANTPSLESISPSSANPGQTLNITITGINTSFSQASGTTVSFSFEQASTTIVNSYNIIDDFNI